MWSFIKDSFTQARSLLAYFASRTSLESRDLCLAALFGWIKFVAPALSSLITALRSSSSAFGMSPASTASLTFLIWVRTALRLDLFLSRRVSFCRSRFFALSELGIDVNLP